MFGAFISFHFSQKVEEKRNHASERDYNSGRRGIYLCAGSLKTVIDELSNGGAYRIQNDEK